MTEAAAAPQASAPAAPQAPQEMGGTVEERANAIFPAVFDDGEAGEVHGDDTGAEPGQVAPPAADKTPDQLAAERKARRDATLAELKAKTRAGVDSKTAQRRADELERQLQAERAERSALVDPRKLTPLQILELGQLAGHTPASIAEALRSAKDPEYVATHAAKKALDPELAELRQQNAALSSKVETFLQQQQQEREESAESAAYGQLADYTSSQAATSPYAASFLKAYGPTEFRKIVEHVLPEVVGGGPQGVLDAVEDLLLERHKQIGAWNPTAAAAPQRTQANPPRHSGTATQAPTHVTNSLAQQRSSVVDEEAALEGMPYEERASFIFKRR